MFQALHMLKQLILSNTLGGVSIVSLILSSNKPNTWIIKVWKVGYPNLTITKRIIHFFFLTDKDASSSISYNIETSETRK